MHTDSCPRCGLCSVPEGQVAQALDTIESLLRRSVRDLGPEAALPPMQPPTPPPIMVARPLLDVLAGHTIADGGRVVVRVRSTVRRNIEAMGGDKASAQDFRWGGP